MAIGTVIKADREKDYERFSVDPKNISPAEDGRRLELTPGNYEWWYFDVILEDNTIICLAMFTAHYIWPLDSAIIGLSIKLPNEQTTRSLINSFPKKTLTAQTSHCDVKIDANRFVGDLSNYKISASVYDPNGGLEPLSIDVELNRTINDPPPIRVGTGYLIFEKDGNESLFGWLAACPSGKAHVKYRIGKTEYQSTGYGYHDHNWGNSNLQNLVTRWYWAKARIKQFTVVAAAFFCSPDYGATQMHQLTITDGATVLFESGTGIAFSTGPTKVDPVTHIPIPASIKFEFQFRGQACYVTFLFQETIRQLEFPGHGGYCRFIGNVQLAIPDANGTMQSINGSGLWELMSPSGVEKSSPLVPTFHPVHI